MSGNGVTIYHRNVTAAIKHLCRLELLNQLFLRRIKLNLTKNRTLFGVYLVINERLELNCNKTMIGKSPPRNIDSKIQKQTNTTSLPT